MRLFGSEIHLFHRPKPRLEEMFCFGCGQDGVAAKKLIAGPPPIFICDSCVAEAEAALAHGRDGPERSTVLAGDAVRRCSFCNVETRVASADGSRGICGDCVRICRSILDEDRLIEARLDKE